MADLLMNEPATLFKGPDMEKFSTRRDTRYFERLEDALRFAVEEMPRDQRYGAYVRMENDHRILKWEEIERLFGSLPSSN